MPHRSTTVAPTANVAHETRVYLERDGHAGRFTNHREANRHLSYQYRAPYRLPR